MKKKSWEELERPLTQLEDELNKLRELSEASSSDHSEEIARLEAARDELLRQIFSDLSAYDRVMLARHPRRPYTLDYLGILCDDFVELHGDRRFGDDGALIGGLARFAGRPCVIIGHQKGRTTKERQLRNFGSAKPEGYRKAIRLVKLAEKLHLPVLSFVDTPAADCLQEAEERGISQAIAECQLVMARARTPIIVTILGEGGSGGAIGIAVGNYVMMQEFAIYSVIPPESCASIIFRDHARAAEAADMLKLTAQDALAFGVIDEIVPEPLGGAHRNALAAAELLRPRLLAALERFENLSSEELVEHRYQRFRKLGKFEEAASSES